MELREKLLAGESIRTRDSSLASALIHHLYNDLGKTATMRCVGYVEYEIKMESEKRLFKGTAIGVTHYDYVWGETVANKTSDKMGVIEADTEEEARAKWKQYLEENHRGSYEEYTIEVEPLEVIK